MATATEHLDYINSIRPKIEEMDKILKPKDFYFTGFYGGRSPEEFEEERDNLCFAVVLKSVFDSRDGCWDDGERDGPLMRALKIPLYYESAGVYSSRNLMDVMSRLLGGQQQDNSSPKHTPGELRSMFLAAGFIENPEIILRWNRRAEFLTEDGRKRKLRKRELYCRSCKHYTYIEVDQLSSPCWNKACSYPDTEDRGDSYYHYNAENDFPAVFTEPLKKLVTLGE